MVPRGGRIDESTGVTGRGGLRGGSGGGSERKTPDEGGGRLPVSAGTPTPGRRGKALTFFRRGGGRGSFVEHTIKVYRQGSHLVADLDAAGFQTAVSLRCDAKVEGAKLDLYFHSYRDETVGEPYRKGQLLLSLEKAKPGRRASLLTNWGAYRPVFRRPKGAGVYFRKT
jgi:hypothetical protein